MVQYVQLYAQVRVGQEALAAAAVEHDGLSTALELARADVVHKASEIQTLHSQLATATGNSARV